MRTHVLALSAAIAAGLCVSSVKVSAKTAGCPCSPCKCSPCTCGAGSSKSGKSEKNDSHHGDREGDHQRDHHGHGGGSVGVGGTIDLGGIGHRNAEPDPFAVGGGGEKKPVAHTEEKRTSKHKEHEPTGSTFDDIKLTGKESKGDMPPNTFNVDNDREVEQPKLPPTEIFTPKAPADAAGDLKKAHDDYTKARSDWLKKQPNYNSVMYDLTQSPNTEEGNRKAARAKKKFDKMIDDFNAGDGKQLVDDWKKTFDSALKSGATVEDNSLVPPPMNDIEKKKYAVIKAQNDLKTTQKNYDDTRRTGAGQDEEVKKAWKAIEDLGASSANDPKYKAAIADLDKAMNKAGEKWAGTDEGKEAAKKLHEAEKELDKAKEAWKPFEKYVEK